VGRIDGAPGRAGLEELAATGAEAATEQAPPAMAPDGEPGDVYSEQEEGQVAERLASLGYLE
jgi:hypothetical protein